MSQFTEQLTARYIRSEHPESWIVEPSCLIHRGDRPSVRTRIALNEPSILRYSSCQISSLVRRMHLTKDLSACCFLLRLTHSPHSNIVHYEGDVLRLEDIRNKTVVSILPSVGDIVFETTIKGQNVLRFSFPPVEAFKSRPSLMLAIGHQQDLSISSGLIPHRLRRSL
jgi:hypothetical protein